MSTTSLMPSSESDIRDLLISETEGLHIAGGQSRLRATEEKVISTCALTGIVEYEPGALTMVAKAGTPLSIINETLQKENQQLAFEPPEYKHILNLLGHSTIGGVFATNASGSRRIQVGAARDHLLGVRFIDGLGRVVKNGGRVMKNVTGYDLVKLMAGSWGTLGIITEVSFKVLPIAETQVTLQIASREASMQQLLKEFSDFEIDIFDAEESKKFWSDVNNLAFFENMQGDLWRISVRPTDGIQIIKKLDPKASYLDWSGGLVWLRVEEGFNVREKMQKMSGHAMCLSGSFNQFHPISTIEKTMSTSIRKKFDPKMLFNQQVLN
ncbi:MAG: FAD-binding protein [Rhodobacterales bacterium]|nr:FAD-binding protein [Rhodobacterales bacterium]